MPGIRLAALVRKLRRDGTPELGGSSDADLLARFAANRDEAAFELLVWRHGAMVLAACRRVLGHTEDAEDAFQAAFLVLARKAGSVRRGVAVPAWLHRVAVRIAGKLARKRRPTALLEVEPAARPAPDPAERGELRGVLDAEIDRLSEPFRRAFVLCYLEGLSNADAARLIGCPVGTIESRLTAARRKLRDRLARRKVELPAGILALLGAQSGLAKETVAKVTRAGVMVADRGVSAAIGIVGEPAAKLAQRELVMTKLRTFAGAVLGFALVGLAAGVGWANLPADPPAQPEQASAEPEVAPQPTPKDGKPTEAWPFARQISESGGQLIGVSSNSSSVIFQRSDTIMAYSLDGKDRFGPISVGNRSGPFTGTGVGVTGFAQSPDGKLVATAEGVNGVKLRDTATGKVVEALWPEGGLPAEQVAFTPDGSKLIALCSRSDLPVRKGGKGTDATAEGFPKGGNRGFEGIPDGFPNSLARKYSKATRVSVWDVTTKKEVGHSAETITSESGLMPWYGLTRNGRFILRVDPVVKTENNRSRLTGRKFTVMDAVTGAAGKSIEIPGEALGSVVSDPISPDGKTLALIDGVTNAQVRLVDVATGKDRFTFGPLRQPIRSFAFSPDGRFVAAATGRVRTGIADDGIAAPSEVVIWDSATGKELAHVTDKETIRNYSALRFSPDGSFLVAQSNAGGVTPFSASGSSVLTIWGRPPEPEPRAKSARPAPKTTAPADVPERFQTLFASLAADGTTDARRVEGLFLASLGRLPSDVESRTLVSQLAKRSDKAEAMKDLLGTLVETAEFKAHAEALGRLAK